MNAFKYKLFVAPNDGETVLALETPILSFDTVTEFKEFAESLVSAVPDLESALQGKRHPVPADYAKKALRSYERHLLTGTLDEVLKQKKANLHID